ncbi:MAG: tetratricopeptide repeat protein [Alphaproteobacteria bacterium]
MTFRLFFALISLLAAFVFAGLPALADEWVEIKSENFLVYSNAEPGHAAGLVEDLEIFRNYLIRVTNVNADYMAAKKAAGTDLPFLVFGPKNDASFKSLTGQDNISLSFNHPRGVVSYINFGFHPDPFEGRRGKPGRQMLFYEYTRYFLKMYSNFNYPIWYVQGLAMYLSTFEVKDGVAMVALPHLRAVRILGSAFSHHLTPIEHILGSTREFPAALTGMGNEVEWTLREQPANLSFENNQFTVDHNHSGILNARTQMIIFKYQAWGIVHYLQSTPDYRKKLVAYLIKIDAGEDFEAAFEEVFQEKMKDFAEKVYGYTERKLFPSYEVEFLGETFSPEVSARELDEAEGEFIKAKAKSYLLGQKKRLFAIKNQLQEVSSKFRVEARTLIAEMEFFTGKLDKAKKLSAAILADNPDYGRANGVMGALLAEQGLVQEARKYLRKALSQNQNDLVALYYLGRTYLKGENQNVAEGAGAMSRYFSLYPYFERARLELAILDAKTDNMAYSLAELKNLASWGSNEAIRAQAAACLLEVRETLNCDLKDSPLNN